VNVLLLGDLVTCLQLAGVWLDPLTIDDGAYDNYEDEVLSTLRSRLPEQYAGFLWRMYEGYSEARIDVEVTSEINALLPSEVEFVELSEIAFGLPPDFMGVGLYDEGYSEASRGAEMALLFGVHDDDKYSFAAHKLMRDAREDDLSWALAWLFSSSGNTLIDMSHEEAANDGMPPVSWDELEMYREIHEEAYALFDRAMSAFGTLEANTDAYGVFCSDLLRAYWRSIEEAHYVRGERPAYERAAVGREGSTGRADPDPEIHALRDRAA
jgi:hypothetical protein